MDGDGLANRVYRVLPSFRRRTSTDEADDGEKWRQVFTEFYRVLPSYRYRRKKKKAMMNKSIRNEQNEHEAGKEMLPSFTGFSVFVTRRNHQYQRCRK